MIRWATKNAGDVNHITGDVHFLALGLDPSTTVLTIHDLEILSRLRGASKFLLKLFWFTLPVKRSRVVTVISECTKQDLLKNIACDADKVFVVPDAVDQQFQPQPKPFPRDKPPTILQIGTRHNKNLERVSEALAGLNVQLHVVGRLEPQQVDLLKANKITFRNSWNLSKEDLLEAYQSSDLLSFVSTSEGFGMPILEAQWIERPVLTSNVSSMPEVAGDGALLVDPFNVESIRNGFKRLLSDSALRCNLIERGKSNRRRFSLEQVSAQYLQIYEKIIHRDRR
jgi:glycosyltransferase involved in cell wall biosynthesis